MLLPADFTLVGMFQKSYGLTGEMKVRPETFDFDRYKSLKTVFARGRDGDVIPLEIKSARGDGQFWYFRFDGRRTPEAVTELSGREMLIDSAERLPLPEGMVYFSDVPGMRALDENGAEVGVLAEVRETGSVEYLVIRTSEGEIPVPWNDHFVTRIDPAARVIHFDLSQLRGVLF